MKRNAPTALLFFLVSCCILGLSGSTFAAGSVAASTALADTFINGAPITTQNDCGPSAITDVRVVTRRAQVEVGQTFHVFLTVVAVNRCGKNPNQSFGVNLKLPKGVEVDPAPRLSGCIVFRSTAPTSLDNVILRPANRWQSANKLNDES